MADADPRASSRIFISYRREDSSGHVLALLPALRTHFGANRIFKDTDNIPPGADFQKFIKRELDSCAVLLAIIGREWLTVQDPRAKRRRIDNPNDFLRVEVGTALKNEKITVIPVLIERAAMPDVEDLPADLAELRFRNAVELNDSRWDSDVRLLIQAVEAACASSAAKPEPTFLHPDLADLQRRRTREIAGHLASAREAFEGEDYEGAVLGCKKALLLDPQSSEALELLDRARKSTEEQKIQAALQHAREALGQRDIGTASDYIDQALAIDNMSEAALTLRKEMLALRRERERERDRTRVIKAAIERAQASLEEGDFDAAQRHADDALNVDPEAAEAQAIKAKALEAVAERRRQREHKRMAQLAVATAREKFAAGAQEAALQLLREFSPPHEIVAEALNELQQEFAAIQQRRRLVDDAIRAAAEALAAGRFQEAISQLSRLAPITGDRPEVTSLLEEAKRKQAAALVAEEARRRADARLAQAAQMVDRQDYPAALELVEAARSLDPQHPDIEPWLRRIEAALAGQAATTRRAEAINAAIDEATRSLNEGDFESAIRRADAALAIDSAHDGARALRDRARSSLAERRAREEHERLVGQTIERARALFDAGEHGKSIKLLAEFRPTDPQVSAALDRLREEVRELERRRQREAEEAALQRAEQERAAAERKRADAIRGILARGRERLLARDFAAALRAADELMRMAPDLADVRELRAAASDGLRLQAEQEEQDRLAREAAERERKEAARLAEEHRRAEAREHAERERLAQEAAERERKEAARRAEERRLAEAREREQAEAARQQAALALMVSRIEGHLAAGELEAAEALLNETERTLPPSGAVGALRNRARALREQEAQRARAARAQQLLADAQSAFQARSFRAAKRHAKAVLELEPDNEAARSLLASATRELHSSTAEFWTTWRRRGLGAAAILILSTTIALYYYGQTASPPPEADAPQVLTEPVSPPLPSAGRGEARPPDLTSPPKPAPSSGPTTAAESPTAEEKRQQLLEELRGTAREQLRRGRRAQALNTAKQGLQLEPNDPVLVSIVDALLEDAQNRTRTARSGAINAGAPAHAQATFSRAVKLEEDATRSRDANRKEAATQTFWEAADQYAASEREATKELARLKQFEDLAKQKQVADAQRDKPSSEQPGNRPPSGQPGGATAQPSNPEVSPPRTPDRPVPEPAPPPVNRLAQEKVRIEEVVRAYEHAYDSLDATAVKAVYPGAPDDLARKFKQFEAYRLEMILDKPIEISPDGSSATARYRVSHYFKGRVGDWEGREGMLVFTFQKRGDTWIISRQVAR